MLLEEMSVKLLQHWSRALQLTSMSMVRSAELAGRVLDECLESQRSEIGTALSRGASAFRWAWEWAAPTTRAHCNPSTRVALVTNGTGSLGTEICAHLDAAGYRVVATYPRGGGDAAQRWRRVRRLEGRKVAIVECDLGHHEDCARMAVSVGRRFGQIDVLVNCIEFSHPAKLEPARETNWNAVLEADLDRIFNVTRIIMPGMAARHYGRIINVASGPGRRAQRPGTTHRREARHAAAKAGMLGFTRSLARALADQGITVNAVSRSGDPAPGGSDLPEGLRSAILARGAAARLHNIDELAVAVAYLADEASSEITGADIMLSTAVRRLGSQRSDPPALRPAVLAPRTPAVSEPMLSAGG